MTKSFKIARRPGQAPQATGEQPPNAAAVTTAAPKKARAKQSNGAAATAPALPQLGTGPTTRKTIEVPEDYFYLVKMRALQRHIKEKELWAEILKEYFTNHPML